MGTRQDSRERAVEWVWKDKGVVTYFPKLLDFVPILPFGLGCPE